MLKKEERKSVVDLSNFDVWYEMNYIKGQNIQPPKVITFKEHIRVLCERDSQYEALLKEYNELVEKYNALVGVEKMTVEEIYEEMEKVKAEKKCL